MFPLRTLCLMGVEFLSFVKLLHARKTKGEKKHCTLLAVSRGAVQPRQKRGSVSGLVLTAVYEDLWATDGLERQLPPPLYPLHKQPRGDIKQVSDVASTRRLR